jgi:hypothetical protein
LKTLKPSSSKKYGGEQFVGDVCAGDAGGAADDEADADGAGSAGSGASSPSGSSTGWRWTDDATAGALAAEGGVAAGEGGAIGRGLASGGGLGPGPGLAVGRSVTDTVGGSSAGDADAVTARGTGGATLAC